MDQVNEWLQSQRQSTLDASAGEDFKLEDWLVIDPALKQEGQHATASASANTDATPNTALADQHHKPTTMRQLQPSTIMHATSHAAWSIPADPSPGLQGHQQPHGLPDPGMHNSKDLFGNLASYHGSSDLYNSHNQDPHLARSRSQHNYPDPPTANAHYTNPHDPSSQYVPGPYLPEAQNRSSNMDGFGQHYYGGHQQMFVPTQADFTFSPSGDFVQPLFPGEAFDEIRLVNSRGHRNKGKGRAASPMSDAPKENPSCIDCGKKYRTSGSPGRCSRCGAKYERRVAGPFTYTLDSSVPDFAAAQRQIFSHIEGRRIYHDDVHQHTRYPSAEDHFVQELLNAVNNVQSLERGDDTWSARQQKNFNEKAKLEPGYTNALVTARLRALYREVLNYHLGGDAVYAVGGDNSGYSDDRTLRFSQRMKSICEVLEKNKRVVMDIVEGRGVQGFVCNPKKYHERKASNNNCNVEKKRIMEKGKEIEAELGSMTTVTTSRGKRGRTAEAASPMSALDDFEEGPSEKRMRIEQSRYSPTYDGGNYGPGQPMQAQWFGGFGAHR